MPNVLSKPGELKKRLSTKEKKDIIKPLLKPMKQLSIKDYFKRLKTVTFNVKITIKTQKH